MPKKSDWPKVDWPKVDYEPFDWELDFIEWLNTPLSPELEKLLNEPIEPIDIGIEIIDLDKY
jgi:hypothetical protein